MTSTPTTAPVHPSRTSGPTTLVVGGTGKTGRRVTERLTTLGHRVRAVSRHSTPRFDWQDQTTWRAALQDVDRMYVTYSPDVAMPGGVEAIDAITRLATESGVRRVVLLSGRGESEAQAAEAVVAGSGLEWAVVRCALFAQNFDEGFFRDGILDGAIAMPSPDVQEPVLDVDDVADVAVAALLDDRHLNTVHELTGPELLTFQEMADRIGEATGRTVTYVPMTVDAYVAALVEAGEPADVAGMLADLFATIFDGRNASVTDGVQRALGQEPRGFDAYVKAAAASGAWVA